MYKNNYNTKKENIQEKMLAISEKVVYNRRVNKISVHKHLDRTQ